MSMPPPSGSAVPVGRDTGLLDILERHSERREFAADARIFDEGSPSDSFHIIGEGEPR